MNPSSKLILLAACIAGSPCVAAQSTTATATAAPVAAPTTAPAPTASPAPATPAAAPAPAVKPLPPMWFYSSIGGDDLYNALKADPVFANVDKELSGTPLYIMVTHSIKPTSGGTAAGLLTAFLSGSTLGIIPVVTNEEYVVRYEIGLQGHPIANYSFSRTKTRAINIWATGGNDPYYGLGKEGFAWLKGTVAQFAEKASKDPKLAQVQSEIDYYFPTASVAAAPTPAATAPAALPAPPPAPPAPAPAAPAGAK